MQRGLLEAIFSTSTVAAGVNFPARTVVLVQSDRFDGREFRDLSARDFHQMVGRAGRRGKDRIGFAVLLPGPHLDPGLILSLVHASPEPLESRIQVNFSMVLNLLLSHHPEEARALLERSFASFQRGTLDPEAGGCWERLVLDMAVELSGGLCDIRDPFEVLDTIERRDELRKTLRERKRDRRKRDERKALQIHLEPGRLFLHQKGGVHLLFRHHMEDDQVICEALDLERPLRTKGGKIRLRRVRPRRIQLLFDRVLDLPPDPSARTVSRLVEELNLNALDVLELESRSAEGEGKATDIPESLPCEACPRFKDCHTPKNRRLRRMISEARSFGARLEGTSEGLWFSFKRHLRFLKETGFVDNRDRLTEDGVWASRLRLDHPLLIAEAIRKGAFDGATPDLLAGIMAPFVWDRSADVIVQADESGDVEPLEDRWSQVMDAIERIRVKKTIKGF
jgi:superfamily II RNA helicase